MHYIITKQHKPRHRPGHHLTFGRVHTDLHNNRRLLILQLAPLRFFSSRIMLPFIHVEHYSGTLGTYSV